MESLVAIKTVGTSNCIFHRQVKCFRFTEQASPQRDAGRRGIVTALFANSKLQNRSVAGPDAGIDMPSAFSVILFPLIRRSADLHTRLL